MRDFQPLEYRHEDTVMTGALAVPEGPGPHPGVLVMHDALGVSQMVRRRARELAAMGYVALVTDMYGGPSEDTAFNQQRFVAMQADRPRLRARAVAALDALRGVPGVDPARLGAIGYCFGGQCVLEIARSGANLRAVASFHGLLTTQAPAQGGAVRAGVLAITGAHDPYAPLADVQGFEAEMAAAGAQWQLTVYGQGWHAFTDPEIATRTEVPGLRYDPLLDRLSWQQCTAFLDALVRF